MTRLLAILLSLSFGLACGKSSSKETNLAAVTCAESARLVKACEKSLTGACTQAARCFFDGKGGHALDLNRSFGYAKRACEAGEADGCNLLGLHYQDGRGTPWSPADAKLAYAKSCDLGAGGGCYNLAGMYFGAHGIVFDDEQGRAFTLQAKAKWQAACESDEARWCTNLGFMHATAAQTDDEKRIAMRWHQRACDHKDLVGCVERGALQLKLGEVTPDAFAKEMTALCEQKEPTACLTLGVRQILGGEGIAKDEARGIELTERACELGSGHACAASGEELVRKPGATPADMDRGAGYYRQACDRGVSQGCTAIAKLEYQQSDMASSVEYATRACHMGDKDSCAIVASMYQEGLPGVEANPAQALSFTREACRMGDSSSCQTMVLQDLDLPLAKPIQQQMYQDACNATVASACARLQAP